MPSTLKRELPAHQKLKFSNFSDPGTPLNPDPNLIRIRTHNTAFNSVLVYVIRTASYCSSTWYDERPFAFSSPKRYASNTVCIKFSSRIRICI